MIPKYRLPDPLIAKAVGFSEFANGGAQATVKLKDGPLFKEALISNATWIIALRGYKYLPFDVSEIEDLFQADEDISPRERDNWDFWDDWGADQNATKQ